MNSIPETTACDCPSADWNRPLTAALEIERLRNEREMMETTDEVVAALRGRVPGIGSAAMNDLPETTPTWDRECVKCGCKWLDSEKGDACPDCEDYVRRTWEDLHDEWR